MSSDAGTNGNQFVDTTLHAECIDLGIEFGIGHTTLKNIAENERALLTLTACHEVEGDVQRVDVVVVGVVD